MAYAAIIRNLHDKYKQEKDSVLIAQIKNIKQRLYLTRSMQIFGISSLLLCVLTMFLIYVQLHNIAIWVFGFALLLLIISLSLLIIEIQISVKALEHHISDIENKAPSMANKQAPVITIEGNVVLGSLTIAVKRTIKEKFIAFANNMKAAFDNENKLF